MEFLKKVSKWDFDMYSASFENSIEKLTELGVNKIVFPNYVPMEMPIDHFDVGEVLYFEFDEYKAVVSKKEVTMTLGTPVENSKEFRFVCDVYDLIDGEPVDDFISHKKSLPNALEEIVDFVMEEEFSDGEMKTCQHHIDFFGNLNRGTGSILNEKAKMDDETLRKMVISILNHKM